MSEIEPTGTETTASPAPQGGEQTPRRRKSVPGPHKSYVGVAESMMRSLAEKGVTMKRPPRLPSSVRLAMGWVETLEKGDLVKLGKQGTLAEIRAAEDNLRAVADWLHKAAYIARAQALAEAYGFTDAASQASDDVSL